MKHKHYKSITKHCHDKFTSPAGLLNPISEIRFFNRKSQEHKKYSTADKQITNFLHVIHSSVRSGNNRAKRVQSYASRLVHLQ